MNVFDANRRRLIDMMAVAAAGFTASPCSLAQQSLADSLPEALAGILRRAQLPPDQVGLWIAPLGAGSALASLNAGQAFNPASCMKLLTTYSALMNLGPDYRWRTTAHLRGRLDGDVLRGDLVIRGSGDPKLVIEDLQEWFAQMRRQGLREIRGDLVLDDSVYALDERSVESFDGDPSQPYNVRPFGVLMNFKATRLKASATVGGASIEFDPPLADIEIVNATTRGGRRCEYGVGSLWVRDIGSVQQAAVKIQGPYSAGCGDQSTMVAVLDHRQFIHGLVKALWLGLGGQWSGSTRIERHAVTQGNLAVFAQWVSPRSLADVVNDVNKFSNNVMARHLLLHTATVQQQRAARVEDAAQYLSQWLQTQRLGFPELVVDNGSGLSRRERISAINLFRILSHAQRSPVADLLRLSLPNVGIDGTMRTRLQDINGSSWLKTGSLSNVRSLAGYVDAASGRRLGLVLMINGPRAEGSSAAQDAIVRWTHANG
jgi:serine-type D-Ala-D-Ala carboxypeptidase/endopeptidase (penicillin-binding protein 4)